ncbi:MAG: hypothetical protein AABW53_01595 [Nanoarchaeota archaeon]
MSKTEVRGTEEKKLKFSIDDILAVAAATYCESIGKTAGDYDLVPVRCRTNTSTSYPLPDITEKFASRVPEGTEMVADYRENIAMNNYIVLQSATGTALVPRK